MEELKMAELKMENGLNGVNARVGNDFQFSIPPFLVSPFWGALSTKKRRPLSRRRSEIIHRLNQAGLVRAPTLSARRLLKREEVFFLSTLVLAALSEAAENSLTGFGVSGWE